MNVTFTDIFTSPKECYQCPSEARIFSIHSHECAFRWLECVSGCEFDSLLFDFILFLSKGSYVEEERVANNKHY